MFDITALMEMVKKEPRTETKRQRLSPGLGVESKTFGLLGGTLRPHLTLMTSVVRTRQADKTGGPGASRVDSRGLSKITPVTTTSHGGNRWMLSVDPALGQG